MESIGICRKGMREDSIHENGETASNWDSQPSQVFGGTGRKLGGVNIEIRRGRCVKEFIRL